MINMIRSQVGLIHPAVRAGHAALLNRRKTSRSPHRAHVAGTSSSRAIAPRRRSGQGPGQCKSEVGRNRRTVAEVGVAVLALSLLVRIGERVGHGLGPLLALLGVEVFAR